MSDQSRSGDPHPDSGYPQVHEAPDIDEAGFDRAPDGTPPAAEPSAADRPASSDEPTGHAAGEDTTDAGTAPESESREQTAGDGDAAPTTGRRGRRRARRTRRKAPWWELPVLILLAVGIAVLVKTFVVQPFYIPSQSMEKTLHGCPTCDGDRILVDKPIYSLIRDPHPGDIVVFKAPTGWEEGAAPTPPSNPVVQAARWFGQLVGFVPPDDQVLVKRVIAVGGQTVKGDGHGHVLISTSGADGPYRTLQEPYVYAPPRDGSQSPFGPVTVPKGRLWVMGDHRNDSADSRYHCTPGGVEGTQDDLSCNPKASTVPVGNVIGKAFVIAWPPSRWRTLGTPATFEQTASAAGAAVPPAVAAAVTVPVFLVRRRRRAR